MGCIFIGKQRFEQVIFSSEDELESIVTRHAPEIFWSWVDTGQSIFVDKKKFLRSKAGIGTIPDGYLLWLDIEIKSCGLYFVEIELSSHSLYDHIVPQIIRFKRSLSNHKTRETILDFFYNKIRELFKKPRFKEISGKINTHTLINNLLDEGPGIIVVIDKTTDELKETIKEVKRLVEETYILEVNVFVDSCNKKPTKSGTKIWARYPKPYKIEFPEWYSAMFRKKVANQYLVKWSDGDKTNTKVDRIVPYEDYIIFTNDIRV